MLVPGKPAPDFAARSLDGRTVRRDDYRGRNLLLIFLRHLAWLPCQSHLGQVREQLDAFRRRDTDVLVISFGTPERIAPWAERLELPFPVAADPERRAYDAYGVGSGSLWDVWGPRVLWRYLVLRLKGNKLQKPAAGDDLEQLGGDFVLDGEGRLLFTHVARTPVDRPPVERLLAPLDRPASPT